MSDRRPIADKGKMTAILVREGVAKDGYTFTREALEFAVTYGSFCGQIMPITGTDQIGRLITTSLEYVTDTDGKEIAQIVGTFLVF